MTNPPEFYLDADFESVRSAIAKVSGIRICDRRVRLIVFSGGRYDGDRGKLVTQTMEIGKRIIDNLKGQTK